MDVGGPLPRLSEHGCLINLTASSSEGAFLRYTFLMPDTWNHGFLPPKDEVAFEIISIRKKPSRMPKEDETDPREGLSIVELSRSSIVRNRLKTTPKSIDPIFSTTGTNEPT